MDRKLHIQEKIDPKKIHLRPLKKEDVTMKYVSWLNDAEINRYLEVRHSVPLTIYDVIEFVEKCRSDKRPHWGIFYDDRHIGNISCSLYNLRYRWVDISFLIGEEDMWGKGICSNAVASILDYLLIDQSFHRVQGGTCSENKSSIKVFQKLGFIQEARFREAVLLKGRYVDDLKFGILAEEWLLHSSEYMKYKVCPLEWSFQWNK